MWWCASRRYRREFRMAQSRLVTIPGSAIRGLRSSFLSCRYRDRGFAAFALSPYTELVLSSFYYPSASVTRAPNDFTRCVVWRMSGGWNQPLIGIVKSQTPISILMFLTECKHLIRIASTYHPNPAVFSSTGLVIWELNACEGFFVNPNHPIRPPVLKRTFSGHLLKRTLIRRDVHHHRQKGKPDNYRKFAMLQTTQMSLNVLFFWFRFRNMISAYTALNFSVFSRYRGGGP